MNTAELESADAVDGFSAAMKAQGHDDVDIRATEFPAPSTPGYADTPGEATGVVPIGAATLPQVKTGNGGTTGVIGGTGPSTSAPPDDSPANSSIADEPVSDEKQSVPRLSKQAMGSLLDELTGELVALEDFPHEIDDRAFEQEWLGKHTDLSLSVFYAELLKTGKYTFNVDENGKLLGDPIKYRLAREAGTRIILRVHGGLSEAQKSNFILLNQGRDRVRTEAENRELKHRIILAGLIQGWTYESIAETAGVCPNTVRNVEKKAADDPNSKFGNTKKDRRLTASTLENIEKARRFHAEGKSNSEIARLLGVSPATVTKLLADPASPAAGKAKGGKGKKAAAAQSAEQIEGIAAVNSIPELHRPFLEWLDLDAEKYASLDADCREQAREVIEKASTDDVELLGYAVYGKYLMDFAHELLEERCRSDADEGVDEEAAPGASCPDAVGYETHDVLDGAVHVDEPNDAPVSLPAGDRGSIAEVDNGGARLAVAEKGDEARARVNGFDPEAGHPDRESMAQDDRTRAVEPNLDDRSSPYEKYFGRKGEPKK